jgi:hypothetical protein
MRDSWYSDDRDLVKWAALVHLATREQLRAVVQVAMFRPGKRVTLDTVSGVITVPEAVWAHFRDLRSIRALGEAVGLEISIIDDRFASKHRVVYFKRVAEALRRMLGPKAVLLDPDTGFEPGKPNAKHITGGDLRTTWDALGAGDWLLLYQHRWRDTRWKEDARSKFRGACDGADVEMFRASGSPGDVILLGARKVES